MSSPGREQPVTWFEGAPASGAPPAAFASPFDEGTPHVWVRAAADVLKGQLEAGCLAPGEPTAPLFEPFAGKMFGVLLVRAPDGRVGFLKAFSGQFFGAWHVDGFVPPVFDESARAAVEVPGEVAVSSLTARVDEAKTSLTRLQHLEALAALQGAQANAREEQRQHHQARRAQRRAQRRAWEATGGATPELLASLANESAHDDAERRRLVASHAEARRASQRLVDDDARRLAALERLRRVVSRAVAWQIHHTYLLHSASGRSATLPALFGEATPPSGAGDCCAPKLLVQAARLGLSPLGLAEFWWGSPPAGGGRSHGRYAPACRDKCGPLLPFLLEGLSVEAPRRYRPPARREVPLTIVIADERFVVVSKPDGLLSVPGADAAITDSVDARIRALYPSAKGPLLVHRLDVETSGLLLVALDEAAHTALQAQFIERRVEKRYVAVVEGDVAINAGRIELALAPDPEQRPRQRVDPKGKPAITDFTVLSRAGTRTRVAFTPHTGRTHQLRVHAAHAEGLGRPIVGDRLYGKPEERLLLHAERLRFLHPSTGRPVEVVAPPPF